MSEEFTVSVVDDMWLGKNRIRIALGNEVPYSTYGICDAPTFSMNLAAARTLRGQLDAVIQRATVNEQEAEAKAAGRDYWGEQV